MARDLLAELKQTKPYASVAQEAHISIQRTAAILAHAFEDVLKPHGITATQFNVLRILRGAGPGGLSRRDIRSRLVTLVPDVTRLLDRLEHMGLVSRARGAVDRRLMTTVITKSGLRLLDRVDGVVIEAHEGQLGRVGERRLRTLIALLAAVRQGLV